MATPLGPPDHESGTRAGFLISALACTAMMGGMDHGTANRRSRPGSGPPTLSQVSAGDCGGLRVADHRLHG